MQGKTILVTGGAGAIGSVLSNKLSINNEIYVLDDLSSGYIINLEIKKSLHFIEGSIVDDDVLQDVFKIRFDYVFHLAANFANQNSVDHPIKDLKVNALGTLKLLEYSRDTGVSKFIFASSSCIYGDQSGSLSEIDDNQHQALDTPYAISKLMGEKYVHFFSKLNGLKTVILRYFNSYGPGEYPGKYRNVIPNFMRLAIRGEPLPITGTGYETRDFTYVDDIVHGTIQAALGNYGSGEIFNLGSGKEIKILDLAMMINDLTGNMSGYEIKGRREWDSINRRLANISKAQSLLNYRNHTDAHEGLKQVYEWFRSNDIN